MKKILVLLVILLSVNIFASDKKYTVKVNVVTKNSNIKNKVESYIKRELRSFNDVKVVNDNQQFTMNIIAMEVSGKSGHVYGIALSVVSFQKFYCTNAYADKIPNLDDRNRFKESTKNVVSIPNQYLYLSSKDDLKSICNDIVSDFDISSLEPMRKMLLEAQKLVEESKRMFQ